MERKLDIFDAMAAMDRRDGTWFSRQSDEAKKQFSPPVFLKWASAINDKRYAGDTLVMINELVNVSLWEIAAEHPELVYKLATLCGLGTKQKHEWVGMGKRYSMNKARDLVAQFNPSVSDSEIDLIIDLHTRNSFSNFVDDTGMTATEAKETLKAYDKLKDKGSNRI